MTNSLTQTTAQIGNITVPHICTSRTITVRPADIKAIIDATFPDYKGQKAAVRIQPTAVYNAADLTWQGGSKTEVVALKCRNFSETEQQAMVKVGGPSSTWAFTTMSLSATLLADRGFLKVNKAGASSITIEGRNALESLPADRKVRL